VIDYIYYPILKVYGNLADIALVAGVLLLLLSQWHEQNSEREKNE
jgi:lipoprotein signal peptidase